MDIELEVKKISEQLNEFSLPVIKLTPKAASAESIWDSKFGGKPYWPKKMQYPKTIEGAKLYLLAQLNFSEMPQLAGFPSSGILQFFIEEDDVYGMDFDSPIEEVIQSPNGYRVVYHSEVTMDDNLIEDNIPKADEDCYLPLSKEYRLSFSIDSELPSPTDFRYERYADDPYSYPDELANYIYENFSAEGSKVGGYANFTQEDPRLAGKHDNWVLLFQLDSVFDDDIDIMWGDSGVGNFFIEEDALEKCEFSRVWYNWDCS